MRPLVYWLARTVVHDLKKDGWQQLRLETGVQIFEAEDFVVKARPVPYDMKVRPIVKMSEEFIRRKRVQKLGKTSIHEEPRFPSLPG
jgi:hypothetical protein